MSLRMAASEPLDHLPSPRLDGISLSGFRRFFDLHGGLAAFNDLTTSDIKHTIVLPATKERRCPYVDLLRPLSGAVGTANVFLSHVYTGKMIDAFDAAASWEERQGGGCVG
jgi:hypothetical protein